MEQLEARRYPRVTCAGAVCRLSGDVTEPVLGRAINVSSGGIFVKAAQSYTVGTELYCDVALAHERFSSRGRVVWAQDAANSGERGFGIAFENPVGGSFAPVPIAPESEEANQHLAQVWFENVSEPLRAEARIQGNAMLLRTWLPFLRMGSEIRVGIHGAHSDTFERGIVQDVALRLNERQPVPCLELTVSREGATERRAPAMPSPAETQAETYDSEAFVVEEIDLSNLPGPASADSTPAPASSWSDHSFFTPAIDPALQTPDTLEMSHWSMEGALGKDDDDDLDLESIASFWGERRRKPSLYRWLWLAAMAMTVIAIASAIETGLWERVGSQLSLWLYPQQSDTSASSKPSTASYTQTDSATSKAAVASTTPATDQPEEPTTRPETAKASVTQPAPSPPNAAEPLEPKTTPPQPTVAKARETTGTPPQTGETPPRSAVVPPPDAPAQRSARAERAILVPQPLRDGVALLTLPIQGSLRGVQRYPLSHPDGFVVRLPHAQPRIAFGDYGVGNSGLRLVWVRPYDQGVQLRFLFSRPTPRYDIEVTDRHVSIELQPTPVEPTSPGT